MMAECSLAAGFFDNRKKDWHESALAAGTGFCAKIRGIRSGDVLSSCRQRLEYRHFKHQPQTLSKMSKMELGLYFTHYAQVLSKMSKIELGLYFTHHAQVLSKMSKIELGLYFTHYAQALSKMSKMTVFKVRTDLKFAKVTRV